MNGVGQARLGSNGALGSNPALLAWLAKKNEFISSNNISFYKFQAMDGTRIRVSPDVVPRLAASSEGFGNWGHSWGAMIDQQKLSYSGLNEGYDVTSEQQSQSLIFAYAFGYQISSNHSFGIGFHLGRVLNEIFTTSNGEEAGIESSISVKSKNSFWIQSLSIGWASGFENWAFGASGKFGLAKFAASGSDEITGYTEANSSLFKETNHSVDNIKLSSDLRFGFQRKFETSKIFYDLDIIPKYYDPDSDEERDLSISHLLGYERNFLESMQWYSGFTYLPGHEHQKDAGVLGAGLSKKGKNSTQFGGVSLTRELQSAANQVYKLIFGTKFEY